MARLTITTTVDNADLAAFLALDEQLTECVRARMNEVFGDDGAVLSSVLVDAVLIGEDGDADSCEHDRVACVDCSSRID